jgi:uncharacterized DUF497 family protein
MSARYGWDPKKAVANERKHGVSFYEAVTAFADPLAIIVDDGARPERAMLLGLSRLGRILVTVFIADEDMIRIISARRATRSERRRHEEGE